MPSWLVAALAGIIGAALSYLIFVPDEYPTISQQRVPASLHCTEEEAITFASFEIKCVHIDRVSDN